MATNLQATVTDADLSSPLAGYNIDQLPSYQIDITPDGQPQAPWWSDILQAGVDVGKGFAGAAIVDNYQRAGINYQGPVPYITNGGGRISAPGVVQAGTVTVGQQQLVMLLIVIVAAAVLLRGA